MDLKTKIEVLPCSKCEDMIDCESCYLQKESQELYEQIRADTIEEYKYDVVLFREIFLEELERQAVDREEIFMYRNICSMAWKKYLEQLKEQKK